MSKVRIGIIGLGFMGSTHFRIYRSLPNAEIVALADVDPAKRKGDISKVNGNIGNDDNSIPLDMTGVTTYENGFDLINDPNVDVVDVCVPTPYHKDYMVAALNAGKHLFSEKPLCRSLEDAKEIEEAVKNAKGFINIGMCVRAWPEYNDFYRRFHAGEFGKAMIVDFRRLSRDVSFSGAWENWFMDGKRAGGALLDMHLHDTDFITYLLGRPQAVTSFGRSVYSSDGAIDHLVTTYDYGTDGPLVTATGGWTSAYDVPFEMSFQIICEKATVRFMSEGYKVYWTDKRVETPVIEVGNLPTGWHQELAYFVECIQNNVKPDRYQTFQSVLDAFKVVMAEEKSCKTNQKVVVEY
ncbi:MAG: Gfo/Idh/MocA family oxidoreductase [Lentisphaeria bacterium]|nr:Gfo/Idh/MocA family oxidoreductase [Lentisphaeria bacterium]